MPPTAFGITEFQLVLLRRMADFQPELVERARTELGASVTQMREANAYWQRMTRSRTFHLTVPALCGFLGAPASETERTAGNTGMRFRLTRWDLPLWPDLQLEAIAGPDGAVMDYALARDPAAPAPKLTGLDDLEPWSCVIGDVATAFRPARMREGSAPSRRELLFAAPAAHKDNGTAGTAAAAAAAIGRNRSRCAASSSTGCCNASSESTRHNPAAPCVAAVEQRVIMDGMHGRRRLVWQIIRPGKRKADRALKNCDSW